MNKNQFFIVGAQRSGTTYLYTVLDEHPEICMAKPLRPEPKYFLNEKIDISEYRQKFFKNCTKLTKIFGEKSTSYYENEEVAKRIKKYFPLAKIIFILANPVERAISNYKFSVENGLEKRSLREVFLEKKQKPKININTSVDPFDYIGRGMYYKYLEKYLKYFPKEQVYVLIKEEFIGNITEIKTLYKYLEVNNNFIPQTYDRKINSSKLQVELDKEVIDYLKEVYEKPNKILEEIIQKEVKW